MYNNGGKYSQNHNPSVQSWKRGRGSEVLKRRRFWGYDCGGFWVPPFGVVGQSWTRRAMDGEREILHKSVPLLQPTLDLTPIKVCGLFISQHDFYETSRIWGLWNYFLMANQLWNEISRLYTILTSFIIIRVLCGTDNILHSIPGYSPHSIWICA